MIHWRHECLQIEHTKILRSWSLLQHSFLHHLIYQTVVRSILQRLALRFFLLLGRIFADLQMLIKVPLVVELEKTPPIVRAPEARLVVLLHVVNKKEFLQTRSKMKIDRILMSVVLTYSVELEFTT